MEPLNWGILGASNFARQHMGPAIHAAPEARLVAIGTGDPAKAAGFSAFAPDIRCHQGYEAVLADPQVDAVYIPLPNHLHVEWSLRALEAGKHVLCEKPMTLLASEFDQLIAARDRTGLLAAEAFMIVHHPQFIRAREIVRSGVLGPLRHVTAAFSYFNNDMGNIRNQSALGGGGLADIGVYIFGGTRFVTGQEPLVVSHAIIDRDQGVDTYVQMTAEFPDFRYAGMVSIRMAKRQEMVFHGEKGVLRMTCPFNAGVFDQAELHLETEAGKLSIERFPGVNQYQLQVTAFGKAARGDAPYACPLEFSRGTQIMIDLTLAAGQAG